MDAAQIKQARKRLHRAWLYGGLLWSTFFLFIAWGLTWVISSEAQDIVRTALILALCAELGLIAVARLVAALRGSLN